VETGLRCLSGAQICAPYLDLLLSFEVYSLYNSGMGQRKEPENIGFYKKCENSVRKILLDRLPGDVKVFLFGSRVTNRDFFNSDIDVAILPGENFDDRILYRIKDELEESYIPFKVDIVNLNEVDEDFKKHALKQAVQWR
jgi:predicted nucleotidyltransferase